jgi:hypothetical protein
LIEDAFTILGKGFVKRNENVLLRVKIPNEKIDGLFPDIENFWNAHEPSFLLIN